MITSAELFAPVNILDLTATTPRIAPFMAYLWRAPAKKDSWYTPNFEIKDGKIALPPGPGFGLEFDPEYLKKAENIKL